MVYVEANTRLTDQNTDIDCKEENVDWIQMTTV